MCIFSFSMMIIIHIFLKDLTLISELLFIGEFKICKFSKLESHFIRFFIFNNFWKRYEASQSNEIFPFNNNLYLLKIFVLRLTQWYFQKQKICISMLMHQKEELKVRE